MSEICRALGVEFGSEVRVVREIRILFKVVCVRVAR